MKLSYNWLKDYLDLSQISPSNIAEGLTLSTCEVEAFCESFAYLDEIQLARVLSIEKHPNADRLNLCRVKSSRGELQIVCGADNVRPNMLAALAPVGAKLPLREKNTELLDSEKNRESSCKVRKAKIRGLESFGMLCSAEELGLERISIRPLDPSAEKLGNHLKGILDIEKDFAFSISGDSPSSQRKEDKETSLLGVDLGTLKIGTPLSQLFPLKDFIFDLDNKSITHRPDLWSHFGFARELSAIFHLPLHLNPLDLRPSRVEKNLFQKSIHVQKGAALAYYGLPLGGVQVQASPLWMQARLINIGQRPINNIVDTSNYVMYDVGQPNHAFDASQLKEKSISLVLNHQGLKCKSFTTLDGEERRLSEQSILILDGSPEKGISPIALGGVMGGLASRVQENTRELFVESATFPREQIRRMIKALGLRTDSAQRFEKGLDPSQASPALYRFAQLLKQSCPKLRVGQICGRNYDNVTQKKIPIHLAFIQSRLGFPMAASRVQEILESLGFGVDRKGKKVSPKNKKTLKEKGLEEEEVRFEITVPRYRSQYDIRYSGRHCRGTGPPSWL